MADATKENGDDVMLFVHGIESRYGDVPKKEVEEAAQKIARIHGYGGVHTISSGTDAQIREARKHKQVYGRQSVIDALKDEKVKGVLGFSRGGNLLRGILQDPKTPEETRKRLREAILVGSPETKGAIPGVETRDIPYIKDVSHMHMVQHMAQTEMRRHALAGIRERTHPPETPETKQPQPTHPPSPPQAIKPPRDHGIKSNPGTAKKSSTNSNPATNKRPNSPHPATTYDKEHN